MKEEGSLMTQEEFEKYIGAGQLRLFDAIKSFKSVNRAIRRGHISPIGEIYPDRPFNNRKPTYGRKLNESRKSIYGQIKQGRI